MSPNLLESRNIEEQHIISQLLKMSTSTQVRSMARSNNFHTGMAQQVIITGGVVSALGMSLYDP